MTQNKISYAEAVDLAEAKLGPIYKVKPRYLYEIRGYEDDVFYARSTNEAELIPYAHKGFIKFSILNEDEIATSNEHRDKVLAEATRIQKEYLQAHLGISAIRVHLLWEHFKQDLKDSLRSHNEIQQKVIDNAKQFGTIETLEQHIGETHND